MTRIIVPLVLIIAIFLAFVIWRVQVGRRQKRLDDRAAQREREEWADDLLKGDRP